MTHLNPKFSSNYSIAAHIFQEVEKWQYDYSFSEKPQSEQSFIGEIEKLIEQIKEQERQKTLDRNTRLV